ncbi:hypothetical protein I7I53_10842 [Histoplasma capsulatum var. duboisii H88]|uniref:Secreted protein n=1 Tax=Ajellomyces capsulatus (strain H88) TaxID=544711 RepID=A0A8A1L8D0_AJEC8|nr:hypothetical protein I7I53_10842 [Histoplasma capsulatum var. duboisii H88]
MLCSALLCCALLCCAVELSIPSCCSSLPPQPKLRTPAIACRHEAARQLASKLIPHTPTQSCIMLFLLRVRFLCFLSFSLFAAFIVGSIHTYIHSRPAPTPTPTPTRD